MESSNPKYCDETVLKFLGEGTYGKVFLTNKGALKVISMISPSELSVATSFHYKYLMECSEVLDYDSCDKKGIGMISRVAERDLFDSRESPSNNIKLFYQIALALKQLHDHNILHLDIKRENIFIVNGDAVLGDFGYCCFVEDISTKTTLNDIFGSLPYIKNISYEVDYSRDIFSLAITMIEVIFLSNIDTIFIEYAENTNDIIDVENLITQEEIEENIGSGRGLKFKMAYHNIINKEENLKSIIKAIPSQYQSIKELLINMISEKPYNIYQVVSYFDQHLGYSDDNKLIIKSPSIKYKSNKKYNDGQLVSYFIDIDIDKAKLTLKNKILIDMIYRLYYLGRKDLIEDKINKINSLALFLTQPGQPIPIDHEYSEILKELEWCIFRPYNYNQIDLKLIFNPSKYIQYTSQ